MPLTTLGFKHLRRLPPLFLLLTLLIGVGEAAPIHEAAARGDLEAVRRLVAAGAGVNSKSLLGKSVSYLAYQSGNLELVSYLIQQGADPSPLPRGLLLKEAVQKSNLALTRAMLSTPKAAVLITEKLFFKALSLSHLSLIKLLLEAGAEVNMRDQKQETALHKTARNNSKEITQALLQAGAEVDAKDRKEETPLHKAAQASALAVTRLLVEAGANVQLKDLSGETPLHEAADQGNGAEAEFLLASGAELNAQDEAGNTPLLSAVFFNYPAVAELLIKKGAEVTLRNKAEISPLLLSVDFQDEATTVLLLKNGADPNQKNAGGLTALQMAALRGNLELAKLLVENGAKVNVTDHSKNTALHYATLAQQKPVVEFLVENGAKVNERGEKERTPLHLAAMVYDGPEKFSPLTLSMLVFLTRIPSFFDPKLTSMTAYLRGGSALALAFGAGLAEEIAIKRQRGNFFLVRYLLAKGADPNAVDAFGFKPVDLTGKPLVVRLLKDAME